jgi:phasin family protein
MTKAADTLKTTVEQITATGNKAFTDTVQKSMSAMNDVSAHSKENLEAVAASVAAATKGAEVLGAQALAFSKKSIEDNIAAAKALTSAKSLQEAVELQTGFAKSSMEAFVAEMTKMSETAAASFKDTFSPLNARVTATVEKIQAAR